MGIICGNLCENRFIFHFEKDDCRTISLKRKGAKMRGLCIGCFLSKQSRTKGVAHKLLFYAKFAKVSGEVNDE